MLDHTFTAMKNYRFLLILFFTIVGYHVMAQVPVIVYYKQAKGTEFLAAKELHRYLYVRTGKLPVMQVFNGGKLPYNSILITSKANLQGSSLLQAIKLDSLQQPDAFLLQSLSDDQLIIVGNTETAALYGAYKFIESTGIGFALNEDLIPDNKLSSVSLSGFHKTYAPSFALRGIQPFHDFPEGPDWWNEDDYKAIITQLPKLGMNFIGFHTYPEKKPFGGWEKAEPLTWIGTADEMNADGIVKAAYPALHANTNDSTWDYYPRKTSDFSFGASQIFETDVYGADYMQNTSKWPHTKAENISIFNKTGSLLHDAFTLAKALNVKTCIGTETPLTVPSEVAETLTKQGRDVNADKTKQELYEGIFKRIKATHPLDYYWFWTPESWTWEGEKTADIERTEKDIQNAIAAAKKINAPFTLATCGWVLGPSRNRAEFDSIFSKQMPFAVINRQTGYTPVERAFDSISGRPKWQISWMEDDPGLTAPQLWAGRTLKDALDAYQYGCTGFMGIHWRTEIISPSFAALAKAGWNAASYKTVADTLRDYPVADLYKEWAAQQFGEKAADKTAALFTSLDGGNLYTPGKNQRQTNFPRSAEWGMKGPGMINKNFKPWNEVTKEYDFIKTLENCAPLIEGAANKAHYNYWLNTFYYTKTMSHIGCLLGQMDTTSKLINKAKLDTERKQLSTKLLQQRDSAASLWGDMVTYLLETVNTTGTMGTVANLEQHNLVSLHLLSQYDSLLRAVNGNIAPLSLSKQYKGTDHLIITTRRTQLAEGENLNLKIRVLTSGNVQSATLYWKSLDGASFQSKVIPLENRHVYDVFLSNKEFGSRDFEYYISVQSNNGTMRYPVTEEMNQTVIVW